MTTITRPTLNQALDRLVQSLEAVDDLEGLVYEIAGYVAGIAVADIHGPALDCALEAAAVHVELAVVARTVLDQRTANHPLPAETEGR